VAVGDLVVGVRVLMRLLLHVELEEHASRVLRMDVGLRPAMAALDAAHRLDAELLAACPMSATSKVT